MCCCDKQSFAALLTMLLMAATFTLVFYMVESNLRPTEAANIISADCIKIMDANIEANYTVALRTPSKLQFLRLKRTNPSEERHMFVTNATMADPVVVSLQREGEAISLFTIRMTMVQMEGRDTMLSLWMT